MSPTTNDFVDLGPDAIMKHFSSRAACWRALLGSTAALLVAVLVIGAASTGIVFVISKVLGVWDGVPHYADVIFAIGLFFFLSWPVACMVVAAVLIAGVTTAAARTLLRRDFIALTSDAALAPQQQAPLASLPELHTLLGTPTLSARLIYSLVVAGQPAEWASVRTKRGMFDVLSVKLPHKAAPAVINSQIENTDILPSSFTYATLLNVNDRVSDYFKIYTMPGAEQELYQLLTPNVLWQLVVELDACDVLIREDYVHFVWPEYVLARSIFEGRTAQVEKFTAALQHNIHADTAAQYSLTFTSHPSRLDDPHNMLRYSIILASILSVAVAVFAIINGLHTNNMTYVYGSVAYAILVFIPALLVSLCMILSVTLGIVSFRTMRYVGQTIASLPKVKKYMLYYEGRT